MLATWEAHYTSLRRTVSTLKVNQEFKALSPLLPRPFPDAVALIEHLDRRTSDYDETDAIYRVLLQAAQAGSTVATTALWLGLWKGVDAIYRRWLRRLSLDEVVSELGAAFTLAIHAANLNDINQVAATLVRNTERRLTHERRREDEKADRRDELPDDASLGALRVQAPGFSDLGMRLAMPGDHGAAQAARWVREQLPERDASLIVATVIEGETQAACAKALDLTPVAVRKRHQRALKSLRDVSHFAGVERVFRVRGNKPPPRRSRR